MTYLSKLMATSALAIGVTVGMAGAAPVFDVEAWSNQGSSNVAGVDFAQGYGAHTPLGGTWVADPDTRVGNQKNVAQSPFNDNALTESNSYYSVDPKYSASNPAVLTFATLQDVFSILWGSVDTFNTITFWNGADSWSITGTEVAQKADPALKPLPGTNGNYEISALVNFSGFAFDRVEFESDNIAMEFALPAPIPLPAGGLLLVTALGGLALVRRRKNV